MGSYIDDQQRTKDLPYSIANSTRASDRLELAAGCDVLADRRHMFADRYSVPVFADFEDMVKQAAPDIVAICTTATGLQKPGNEAPTADFRGDAHTDLTVALADLRVPMLYVEKAVACSMRRCDELKDAVKRNNTVFNSGVLRRFDVRYDPVRRAVLDGLVGDVVAVVHYAASSLLHGHIHSIDTLSWLIGDPQITQVRGELEPRDLAIENSFVAHDPQGTYELLFENGVRGFSIPAGNWQFEVLGTEGMVRSLDNGAGAVLRRQEGDDRYGWTDCELPKPTPKSATVSCLEDLVVAYETGQLTRGHVDVTHHITEATIAIAESHRRQGSWVDIPIEDRDLYVFHVYDGADCLPSNNRVYGA